MVATYQSRMIQRNAANKHAHSCKISTDMFNHIKDQYDNEVNKTDELTRNYNIAKTVYMLSLKIAEDAYNAEILLADDLANDNLIPTITLI
jgi:hypothetical protein